MLVKVIEKTNDARRAKSGAMRRIAALIFLLVSLVTFLPAKAADSPRQIIAKAIVTDDDAQKASLIQSLSGNPDPLIKTLLNAWKEDTIFLYVTADGSKIPVTLAPDKDAEEKQLAFRLDDNQELKDAGGKSVRLLAGDLDTAAHDSNLRTVMKGVLDLQALAEPDRVKRIQAIQTLGFSQDPAQLPALQARQAVETDNEAKLALREAIAIIQLTDSSDEVKLAALGELKTLHTLSSTDVVRAFLKEATDGGKAELASTARATLDAIESHRTVVNFFGSAFRGLSLGSILLVVALGLAITFGLMGVINMAHGEMIAVGAYTTYIVQNVFGPGLALSPFGYNVWIPGLNAGGRLYENYFMVALPLSFLAAAIVGIALERCIIQFLYRRPLESLLATWGVSLILQQLFRMLFGANNVQVYSPSYLSGNWTYQDIIFGWNRLFVIGFAVLIVFGVWFILTKTPLGLLMRAVMQNRQMAACMGVRTERVNMLTFGLGSGLAGLAGAFLSQIGNVGPSLGQSYIVDCFMTVVVGGVGNLAGTVISALGIGVVDQSLQQILRNPVLGKILVLVGIISFLQWRPAGLFVTKSRSLEG